MQDSTQQSTQENETPRPGNSCQCKNRCPRCYEVDDHADGCMVAVNLARGVPEFWAAWAIWTAPAKDAVDGVSLFWLPYHGYAIQPVDEWDDDDWDMGGEVASPGDATKRPMIALGPDGPTLAPWEGSDAS